MDVFTYSYDCARWYGRHQGTRNLYLDPASTTEPLVAAKEDAHNRTGSKTCDVHLIQKFRLAIEQLETYPAMAAIPMYKFKQ
jgi:hypothetical protein